MLRTAAVVLTLAAAASPDSTLVSLAQPQSWGAAQPYAPGPTVAFASSGDAAFDQWRLDFVQRQMAAGWSLDFLQQQLAGLTPDPRVETLDGAQPELSKPIGDYIKGAVSQSRISNGQSKATAPYFSDIEQRFGVPREILIAIWAMESGFGGNMGSMDVVRSLATLAAEGRRRDWAEMELAAALRMIQTGEASRGQLVGSWAGAMGQTQFEPDTFLSTAVDGDGDGRRDVWGSAPDALASAANLLAKAGWVRGQSWAVEVKLPAGFDYGMAEGPKQTPAAWQALGVRRADGRGFSQIDQAAEAQLIVPGGAGGPAFLLFPNHFVIRKYNNSTSYALAVGLIADGVAGRPGVMAAWPYDTPMTRADRLGAQRALQMLGFDPGEPDGVIGVMTRAAVRGYQRSRGLPADGYLSNALAQKLMAETGQTSSQALPGGPVPYSSTRN